MKTLQELEEEYADVMNCPALNWLRNWVPKESNYKEPTPEELEARAKRVAKEMKVVMKDFDAMEF
jgi:DNA-binding transcriptional regulator YbjK